MILFSPGNYCNYGNSKKNKTDNDSTLNIRLMQISVEFFHTQTFKIKKWEGAVLNKLSNYIGRGLWCKCRTAYPILQDIF